MIEKFFNKAREMSQLSTYDRIHIGCVAVYHGQIIGQGCNSDKTHPAQEHYNMYRKFNVEHTAYCVPKIHAEMDCLNQIKKQNIQFRKVTLYIYRERLDKKIGMCRPCPACMKAIKELGIQTIYYTTNYGYVHEVFK